MIEIKSCTIEHIDSIMEMQNSVIENNNKTGKENWYIITEKSELEEGLKSGYLLVLGGFCNNELIACIAMSVEDPHNMFKELLNGYNNNEDKQFLYVKMAIVKEGFRGQGLQRKLLLALEDEALKNPQIKYMGAIVHPDNKYSLKNVADAGYEDKGSVIPDPLPGYPRKLIFKTLNRDPESDLQTRS